MLKHAHTHTHTHTHTRAAPKTKSSIDCGEGGGKNLIEGSPTPPHPTLPKCWRRNRRRKRGRVTKLIPNGLRAYQNQQGFPPFALEIRNNQTILFGRRDFIAICPARREKASPRLPTMHRLSFPWEPAGNSPERQKWRQSNWVLLMGRGGEEPTDRGVQWTNRLMDLKWRAWKYRLLSRQKRRTNRHFGKYCVERERDRQTDRDLSQGERRELWTWELKLWGGGERVRERETRETQRVQRQREAETCSYNIHWYRDTDYLRQTLTEWDSHRLRLIFTESVKLPKLSKVRSQTQYQQSLTLSFTTLTK